MTATTNELLKSRAFLVSLFFVLQSGTRNLNC